MSQLSDRGRPFRASQASSRSTLSPVGLLLSGKMTLWLLLLFAASLITFVQSNIDSVEAITLLTRALSFISPASLRFIKDNHVQNVAPSDVNKYEVELEEKVAKIEKLIEIFEPMSDDIREEGQEFSAAQWKSIDSAYEELAKAIQEMKRLQLVLKSRRYIQGLDEMDDVWSGIQDELIDEKKKEAFQQQLDSVKADVEDFAVCVAVLETEPYTTSLLMETSNNDFEKDYLNKFVDKVVPLKAKFDDELTQSQSGSVGGTSYRGRSWYMKKRWWISGLLLTATVLGGGAVYGLSAGAREWVNSLIGLSNSNQMATTTPLGANVPMITMSAPESNGSLFVWIIIGLVLVSLVGAAFYLFWSGRERTSSLTTDNVPKADDDKSGAGSKTGNSASTTASVTSN